MASIAVLGGGPAGAFTAERLASAGLDVTLIDEKLAWEKPCGGGITYKAYSQYPFLIENDTPKKRITHTFLSTGKAGKAALELTRPLLIYSRYELNRMLLQRAENAGAQLEKTRVTGLTKTTTGWKISTTNGEIQSRYCVVANGARNGLLTVGTEWSAQNKMVAFGYYIPVERDRIDIEFLAGLAGYIWVFPRNGHLSAGICAKGVPSRVLRETLDRYLHRNGISTQGAEFYAHVIPSLNKSDWQSNRVCGDGWLAVGDAAGLVDPVTGEGLYYAIRSADLAARSILTESSNPADEYRSALRSEFWNEMETAARLANRLYLGKFLFGDIPTRMIQFMRRSSTLQDVVQDLFAGTQGYLDLKERLVKSMGRTAGEVALGAVLGRSR